MPGEFRSSPQVERQARHILEGAFAEVENLGISGSDARRIMIEYLSMRLGMLSALERRDALKFSHLWLYVGAKNWAQRFDQDRNEARAEATAVADIVTGTVIPFACEIASKCDPTQNRNRGKTLGLSACQAWLPTSSGRRGMARLPATASLAPR